MPEYSMMAFTAAIDQLRMANRLSGKSLYEWIVLAETDERVLGSNGLFVPSLAMKNSGQLDGVLCMWRSAYRDQGN